MTTATLEQTGVYAALGTKADELMTLLEDNHYVAELKQINPGREESTLTIKISVLTELSLFDEE